MSQCLFHPCKGNFTNKPLSTSGADRIRSIIRASKIYKDDLHVSLEKMLAEDENPSVQCHRQCVSIYTSQVSIKRFLKHNDTENASPAPKRSRRSDSQGTTFNFREHCIFCGALCIMDRDPKHPDRWRKVTLCRTADRAADRTYKQKILDTCFERQDNWAKDVEIRVVGAVSDLHAADARYHIDCRDAFMTDRAIAAAVRSSLDPSQISLDSSFQSTVSEMKADMTKIWNSVDVYNLYLENGGQKLSRRALVSHLSDHFGPDLLILSGSGVASLLVFQSKASGLLHLVNDEDDFDCVLERVAKRIVHETQRLPADRKVYQASVDIDIALDSVSETLRSLLVKMSDKMNYTLSAALIGNIVTSILTNRSTPLQIALGVVLNQRSLIEQFYDCRVACSYDEILRFKASAAAAALKNFTIMGMTCPKDGIIQAVADNFDANISSQNGLVSTHSLAIVMTVTDRYLTEESHLETFPRLTANEMQQQVIDDIPVERYKGPKKPDMPDTEAKRALLPLRVLAAQVVSLLRAQSLDFDFLQAIDSDEGIPEFNGFNTKLSREQGHTIRPATRAIYRPLIDMNPADPDTILTAMVNTQDLTNSCGQRITLFTNDQLYRVAVGIKWVYQDRFLNFIPRLGGMHLMMSFVGCVGYLMANTGLEEIMKTSFGGVPKMLSGKKFPQNVRALRLVVEEVLRGIVGQLESHTELQEHLEVLSQESRTTRLWVDCLIKPVFLMMLFVRAEREADWPLHLYAVKEMMPYFFAAGHHHYARYGLYYLRSMERLPGDILHRFLKGDHVMRHKPGLWNGIWSDMFIESTFMRYGHGARGIIGITLKPSALKRWALSMHACTKIVKGVADMTRGYKEVDVTSHKEEKPSRIHGDNQDRSKIREKLQLCIQPLDNDDHPKGLVNIQTGQIQPESVNVEHAVDIGKAQMIAFESSLPSGFNAPLSKKVVTMAVTKKSIKVGGKDVYDVNLIYSRVLGLQQTRDIDLPTVLKHELAPMPTSMFKENGTMRIASAKSTLKKKLQVLVSSRIVQKAEAVIIDGCAILWCVHWPCKGTVKDFVDNVCSFIIRKMSQGDVYLVFDRYFDFSIKGTTRTKRCGQQASRHHRLTLQSPLPPQKVVLTIADNKVQLIKLICTELLNRGEKMKNKLVLTGQDPVPIEVSCDVLRQREDLENFHEEADVIMVHQMSKLAEEGATAINVLCDDTDVFVLLLHFYHKLDLTCGLTMESTHSERALVDIAASAKEHAKIAPQLPAMHCLSGCDTVAQLFGVGKSTAIKMLQASQTLECLGELDAPMSTIIDEATKFIAKCYGCTTTADMSDTRVQVWSRKMGRKNMTAAPKLKTLPPTSQAFVENVRRAHFQTAIWKAALQSKPPNMNPEEYGWAREETSKSLLPVPMPTDVALAPPQILELIRCGCTSGTPCRTAQCGCCAAHLPCTFFCACHRDSNINCHNERTKQVEHDIDNDETDEETADDADDD